VAPPTGNTNKVFKKRLGLKVSCNDLTTEVRAALIAEIPKDLSEAIGVAKDAITNVDPKCDSAIIVTSADAALAPAPATNALPATTNEVPSAPATPKTRRQFRTLATSSGVAVDYTLKSTNDAETERASAELDRMVQSNALILPAAQTAVREVCTTCASLAVDKSSSKTLTIIVITVPSPGFSGGLSDGIIGIVSGVGGAILIGIIISFVYNRKRARDENAAAPNDPYAPETPRSPIVVPVVVQARLKKVGGLGDQAPDFASKV